MKKKALCNEKKKNAEEKAERKIKEEKWKNRFGFASFFLMDNQLLWVI